ncbi:Glutaminyl-tRNA synthetase [Candidatus Purcelliella pentastirinorum]|uniref:Glutamine--tRNA ligase n=1 Tax=Candidatus Purcelliella pentastirinorum TaxID=472834 RepID=A0A346DZ53_9ENTR|nr:glutamine--tRNA ligase [Candidatus Purcelliella pentastirinorum]AXN02008.1 Glutaminyl-tRNA synthetase [Candidatus Purcelliella pentastirinorum]
MNKNTINKNNFIRKIIKNDLNKKKYSKIKTRFAPEPNGYLHLGHVKSLYINYNIAKDFNGTCNVRFDDSNPSKIKKKYIKSIKKDIKWLGFKINNIYYTSNYFLKIYNYAIELIKKKLAYVDELNSKEIKKYRGTLKTIGKDSPYRNRSINDNLKLFKEMKEGKFKEGQMCLRAKINMLSPIILMRDPILYRIKYKEHIKTANEWCIYPMYDFSHCISDALEKITHSICTLEFIDNKNLYNWILKNITIENRPKQYEFSRLNIEYNIMSKRYINKLIKKKIITKWNDPRILTITGLRKRGYTPDSIIDFCSRIGVTKQNNIIEMSLLENCIRNDLNKNSPRTMAIINPIKIILENIPNKYEEQLIINNHPINKNMGKRKIYFNKEIYIDKYDFKDKNNNKYNHPVVGNKIRLKNAYNIIIKFIIKNKKGEIKKIICTCKHKKNQDYKYIKIIHWVSVLHSIPAKFYLYEKLFNKINPLKKNKLTNNVNKKSLIIKNGFVEESLKTAKIGNKYQFEREGYYCLDKIENKSNNLIFNLITNLNNRYKRI